jgi:hypothetical protein
MAKLNLNRMRTQMRLAGNINHALTVREHVAADPHRPPLVKETMLRSIDAKVERWRKEIQELR